METAKGKPWANVLFGRVLPKAEAQIAPARMSAIEKYVLKVALKLADHHCLLGVRSDQTTPEAAVQRSGRFVPRAASQVTYRLSYNLQHSSGDLNKDRSHVEATKGTAATSHHGDTSSGISHLSR